MKCYKKILIFMSLTIVSLTCYANVITPAIESKLSAGEFIWVNIETKKSEVELRKYIDKKINEILYVNAYRNENGKHQFNVFVLNPPKKSEKKEVEFEIKGFDYHPLKTSQNPELVVKKNSYKLTEKKQKNLQLIGISALACVFILIVLILIYKSNTKRKKKKIFKIRGKEVLSSLKNINSREELERIYILRKEIIKYLDVDEVAFKKYLNKIDKLQYKKEWSNEEFEEVKKTLEKIDVVGVKRGI